MRKVFYATLSCCLLVLTVFAKPSKQSITSPDKNIVVLINTESKISYSVTFKGKQILSPSPLSISIDDKVLGVNPVLVKTSVKSVNQQVKPLYGMASSYSDVYNEITLQFKNNYSVLFRVYNNGVAYRFVTSIAGKVKVISEEVAYQFERDETAWMQKVSGFLNSYEEHYVNDKVSYLDSGKIAVLPLLVNSKDVKIAITESDLLDYPGLYLTYNNNNGLKGTQPPFVLKDSVGGCCPNFEKVIVKTAPFIAETDGKRSFPWRLMVVAENDKDLLYNNLVYLLASESKIGDASWVKPGKVVWDWWCSNNLAGVDFKTGFNTETYKYYIDFAAAHGIEYINMDEGWSDQFDLLKLNDGSVKLENNASIGGKLDMPYLFEYAKQKNVGIMLWCVWHTLDRQMEEALTQFEKWGVKGLKVDFMDRDDQTVVNFYERLAKETAKRKMIINYHGAFKPTGFERTYPNVINRESVQGLEYNKFTSNVTPEHAANIPFIRMVAGSMDYTPGGMFNANQKDFRSSMDRPMTQGTRCQQLAMFTIFYAPLEMLSDAPTTYLREPQILKYLASIPTTWDQTVPLDGKIGDYAVMARSKGNDWYAAGLNDWTARNMNLKLDFLKEGKYKATIFTDGLNANRVGNDYRYDEKVVTSGDVLKIEMASGGGFAIKFELVK